MTDDEILSDPVFREAFESAARDPDLIEDLKAWNEILLDPLNAPDLNRLALTMALDLIAKHSAEIH
jgi:hypothetical protein